MKRETGANTMAGMARRRASAKRVAEMYNARQGDVCTCAECTTKRSGKPRTKQERWARMQKEFEARRNANRRKYYEQAE